MESTSIPSPAAGSTARRLLVATPLLYFAWMLLADAGDPAAWLVGLPVALLCALLALPHLALFDGVRLRLSLPLHVLRFAGVFLLELLKANLDMARRVVSPQLPIDPVLVEVHTELHSPLARLLLANAITLTPGTLTVDVEDGRLLVHWIDGSQAHDLEQATRAIAERFETRLKEILL